MAKNLKLNIKNTQLAQALNLGKIKGKLASAKEKETVAKKKQEVVEETPQALPASDPTSTRPAGAAPEEEPRRVKARSKTAPQQLPKIEEEVEVHSDQFSASPTERETQELLEAEEERQRKIAKSKSFLKGDDTEQEELQKSALQESVEEISITQSEDLSTSETFENPVQAEEAPQRKPEPPAKKAEKTPFTPYREAPKHFKKPNSPNAFPELRTRDLTPSVKLGPTGRHIKDLIKPKPPEEVKKEVTPRAAKEQRERSPNADAPLKEQTGTRVTKKDDSSSSTDDSETKRPGKAKEFLDVKPLKKPGLKSFDGRDRQGLRQTDGDSWRKRRPSKHRHVEEDTTIRPTSLKVRLPISIKDLAVEMKLKSAQLVSKLFLQGVIVTLNDLLDDETTLQLLGQEFGCDIQIDTTEKERLRITGKSISEELASMPEEDCIIRSPVVAFMGHVDHGKTSLIDSIRKTNRVAGEAGAITQHIGAFKCSTPVGDITILDTPGHEAFSAMRTRGADVTDIVVLVIAGDEGMKQQTIEALNQARAANVTIVVAINKCDKPGFNAENIYQQLSTNGLLPEAWGGTTITINCSAVTGVGVPQLLEMLALQAEVLELKASPKSRARGTVLESEMHKGLGAVTTVLVQNGTLRVGDALVFETHSGKVKTMRDENGRDLKEAGPSTPVLITGLSGLPDAGQEFIVVKTEKEAKEIAMKRAEGVKQTSLLQKKKINLENLMQQAATSSKKIANYILRADVQGSLEALKASLLNIKSTKIEVNIIFAGVGEISESDVELAAASQAIIIGFHTQVENHAEALIKQTGVKVQLFDIIYHAIEETKKTLVDLLDKIALERDLGTAEVLTTFKSSHVGLIAGCMVSEGSIFRNQKVRLLREGKMIWKGSISSLKRVKEDVKEVKKGFECGILLDGTNDVIEGDKIQCYEVYYLTQEL